MDAREYNSLERDFDGPSILATSFLTFCVDILIYGVIQNGLYLLGRGESQSLLDKNGNGNGQAPERNINSLTTLALVTIEAFVNLGLIFTAFTHSINLIHYSDSILISTSVFCTLGFLASLGHVWRIFVLARKGKTDIGSVTNSDTVSEPSDPNLKLSFPPDLVKKIDRRSRSASWSPVPG